MEISRPTAEGLDSFGVTEVIWTSCLMGTYSVPIGTP